MAQDIPVVVADGDIPRTLADVVLVDNEKGGYEATRYLLSLGHRRIACIGGPSDLTPSADRVRGYRRAQEEAGMSIEEGWIVPGDFRYRGGEAAAAKLFRLGEPPSAIFACDDVMAIGALRTLQNAGLQMPGDVPIIGFDDIPLASAVSPALSTVAQSIVELATLAAQWLISRIQGDGNDGPKRRTVLETRLVVRDSCALR